MADTTDGRKIGAEGVNLHTIGKRIVSTSTMQRQEWSNRSSYSQSVSQSHLRLERIRRWREVHMERLRTRRLRGGSTCPVKLDQNDPNYVDPGEEEEEEEEVLLSIHPHTTSTKPFSQRP
jgi:hypothetical protein